MKRRTLKEIGREILAVSSDSSLAPLIDKYVQYYDSGWRVGTLISVGKDAKIKPLVSKYSTDKNPHCRYISVQNVRAIDD